VPKNMDFFRDLSKRGSSLNLLARFNGSGQGQNYIFLTTKIIFVRGVGRPQFDSKKYFF